MKPQRIQLSRRAGFRLQEVSLALNGLHAVKVDRTTRWGNPFRPTHDPGPAVLPTGEIDDDPPPLRLLHEMRLRHCVDDFDFWLHQPEQHALLEEVKVGLRGVNIACWCKPGSPCHGDVLLRVANAPKTTEGTGETE